MMIMDQSINKIFGRSKLINVKSIELYQEKFYNNHYNIQTNKYITTIYTQNIADL